jgi:hypothetical protein
MKVVNPSSQDRMPRRAIVLPVSAAAAPYRASGLVLWRKAAVRGNVRSWGAERKTYARIELFRLCEGLRMAAR